MQIKLNRFPVKSVSNIYNRVANGRFWIVLAIETFLFLKQYFPFSPPPSPT